MRRVRPLRILVMILALTAALTLPSIASSVPLSTKGPDRYLHFTPAKYCTGTCDGSGGCSTNLTFTVTTTARSTDFNVSWKTNSPNASVTFTWWNGTGQKHTPFQLKYESGSTGFAFINYVAPSTTYWYNVSGVAWGYGCSYATGSLITAADNLQYINGTVTDSSGKVPLVGVEVNVTCARNNASWFYRSALTNSSGSFSFYLNWDNGSGLSLGSECLSPNTATPGFNVTAHTGYPGLTWVPGYWNESILFWAPQTLSILLPANFLGPYVPYVVDFSNAPKGYSSLTYAQYQSTSTTFTDNWSIGAGVQNIGGAGYSGSSSQTITVSTTTGLRSTNGSLIYAARFNESGRLEFNAFVYKWQQEQVSFYGPAHSGNYSKYISGFQSPKDWLTPRAINNSSVPDAYYVQTVGGDVMKDKLVPQGDSYFGWFNTSAVSMSEGGYVVGFNVSLVLGGLPIYLSGGLGWSQSSTVVVSQALGWEVSVPAGAAQPGCFDVIAEGGDGTGSPQTADMVGIYYWLPTSGNGQISCQGG